MPYIDYAEWFRREQARRGRDQVFSPSSTIRPIQRVDTPTSFEQIGGRAVEIGKDYAENELKKEITRRATEYLAQSGKQAATQAGTQAAGQAAAQTGAQTTASTAASAAGTVAGIAEAAKGAYNLSRVINKRQGATAGAVSGAGTGAAIGTMILPGIGTAIGAGIGALGGATLGKLFSPRPKNYEKERWDRLRKYYGFDMPKPEWVDTKDAALKAQDKTLAKDYVGYNEQGKWVNNKFATSGLDTDLKPQDIQEFATNFETFGKEYQVLPEEKRLQMMDIALKNNLVREHKGTVDIAWTPETYQQAASILYNDPNVQNWQANQPKMYESPVYIPPWKRK